MKLNELMGCTVEAYRSTRTKGASGEDTSIFDTSPKYLFVDGGDYDWVKVVAFGEDSCPDFKPEEVDEVVWFVVGQNDGPEWVALCRMKNGRWALLAAGCDYTGWDCQSGGSATMCSDRDTAFGPLFVSSQDKRRNIDGWVKACELHGPPDVDNSYLYAED